MTVWLSVKNTVNIKPVNVLNSLNVNSIRRFCEKVFEKAPQEGAFLVSNLYYAIKTEEECAEKAGYWNRDLYLCTVYVSEGADEEGDPVPTKEIEEAVIEAFSNIKEVQLILGDSEIRAVEAPRVLLLSTDPDACLSYHEYLVSQLFAGDGPGSTAINGVVTVAVNLCSGEYSIHDARIATIAPVQP